MSAPTDTTRRGVYLRDGYRCAACPTVIGLTFQHRRAVGMGGTKNIPAPVDGLTLCSTCNEECERAMQARALANGWKVRKWVSKPERVPIFFANELAWYRFEGMTRVRISHAVAMEMGCSVYGEEWMRWQKEAT
ncbi:hypothetical protein [Microbacterium sp. J1-1]|uniref:hypothetical protein n=1 Tax=Microbacterium sp. J1-1 TaxID=2992441 RepID=UPI0021152C4C|nr:hypothetical protein [Microbacterium sp. J1-1]UUE19347.1 hypothetical protein LRQ07_11050 [Microbacterium sp. J1-1]